MKSLKLRTLTQISMLIALQLVLSRFLSINTDSIRVGFGFIPMVMCGILFGPYLTVLAYAIADIIGAFLFFGSVNPIITLSVMITGFAYGFFLHRENVRFFPHITLAVIISCVVCTGIITTLGISIFYGVGFVPLLLSGRLAQVVYAIIAESVLIPILLQMSKSLVKHGMVVSH